MHQVILNVVLRNNTILNYDVERKFKKNTFCVSKMETYTLECRENDTDIINIKVNYDMNTLIDPKSLLNIKGILKDVSQEDQLVIPDFYDYGLWYRIYRELIEIGKEAIYLPANFHIKENRIRRGVNKVLKVLCDPFRGFKEVSSCIEEKEARKRLKLSEFDYLLGAVYNPKTCRIERIFRMKTDFEKYDELIRASSEEEIASIIDDCEMMEMTPDGDLLELSDEIKSEIKQQFKRDEE